MWAKSEESLRRDSYNHVTRHRDVKILKLIKKTKDSNQEIKRKDLYRYFSFVGSNLFPTLQLRKM